MVVAHHRTRGGRPAAPGPRYDCGRRRPQGDRRGAAAWNRLKGDESLARLFDPAPAMTEETDETLEALTRAEPTQDIPTCTRARV